MGLAYSFPFLELLSSSNITMTNRVLPIFCLLVIVSLGTVQSRPQMDLDALQNMQNMTPEQMMSMLDPGCISNCQQDSQGANCQNCVMEASWARSWAAKEDLQTHQDVDHVALL